MGAGLLARVARAIGEGGLLGPGDRCLVAVSGGPDSVALLDLLGALAPRLGVALVVGHVDHGTRGDEGRRAAGLVARLAAAAGLEYREARLPAAGSPPSEAALRRARYAALARLARQAGCGVVAVGHHRDDQAETVLLRLLRGAGPTGLAGMAPARALPHPEGGAPLRLVRPLLDVPRADLARRVAARGLPTQADPTNADRRYARNALRLDLLPPLRARVNPRLDEALATTAAIVRDEEALVAAQAAAAFRHLADLSRPGEVRVSAARLARLDRALQRRLLRLAAAAAAPRAPAPTFRQIEAARRLLPRPGRPAVAAGPVRWPGRLAAAVERGALVVRREPTAAGRPAPAAAR